MASTPYGVSYMIHGHNGYNGIERIPHVHVRWQGKEVSVSLQDGHIIAGERNLDHNQVRQVKDWVNSNMYDLKREWESKSDSYR